MKYIKNKLIQFYNEKGYPFVRQFKFQLKYRFEVMGFEETVNYIIENRCSIARFGDGEFGIAIQSNHPDFQDENKELVDRLKEVCQNKQENLLVCIPYNFVTTRDCNEFAREFWEWWMWDQNNIIKVARLLELNFLKKRIYGNAQITRPYMDWKDKHGAEKRFDLLKLLWEKKDLLIVEGKKTKLGVNNDLFEKSKSIKRIIAPAQNAFSVYNKILESVIKNAEKRMVLIALGPTATVLAYDLAKENIQALDIGHIDIEYEWFLNGDETKQPIKGKDVQELHIKEVEKENDTQYLSEIIEYVGE